MTPQQHRPPTRVYVKVNSDFDSTGSVTPRAIIWSDGRVFKIDSVRDFRPASALGESRRGDCYTVLIRGEERGGAAGLTIKSAKGGEQRWTTAGASILPSI